MRFVCCSQACSKWNGRDLVIKRASGPCAPTKQAIFGLELVKRHQVISTTTIYPPHPSFSTGYRSPQSWRPNLQSKANALSRSNLISSSTPRFRAARASVSERVVGDGIRTSDWASGRPRLLLRAPILVCRPQMLSYCGIAMITGREWRLEDTQSQQGNAALI